MRVLQATTDAVKRNLSLLCGRQDYGLTAEHCASKKMETEKLGSASPLRVGCEKPFRAPILVAKQQLDRQSAHQPPLKIISHRTNLELEG